MPHKLAINERWRPAAKGWSSLRPERKGHKGEITMPAKMKGPARKGAPKIGSAPEFAAMELQASAHRRQFVEQHNSSTSRVRVLVLCLALFSLFVIAPAAFLSGGSKSTAAAQKGGTIGVAASLPANPSAGKSHLAGAPQDKEPSGAYGGYSYKNDVSPRLRDMTQMPIVQKPEHDA